MDKLAIDIKKEDIKALSVEIQRDLARGLVNAYMNNAFTLDQLLANARYYGLEHLIS